MKSTIQHRVWNDNNTPFTVKHTEANSQLSTNRTDKKNKTIFAGDIVRLHNKSEHVKKEYWNPYFEVVWDGFEFSLKHLGGGKAGDGGMFILRHRSQEFEIVGNAWEGNVVIISPRRACFSKNIK